MCFRYFFMFCRQLHICLYNYNEYEREAWALALGSQPAWLSRANSSGLTPLMLALMYGADVQMVRVLALLTFASTFACADFRNGNGALHIAAQLGDKADAEHLVDALLTPPTYDECRLMLSFVNDDIEGPETETYEHELVVEHYKRAVCAAVNARNLKGETALHVAVRACNPQIASRLLNAGADPYIEVPLIIVLDFSPYKCPKLNLNELFENWGSTYVSQFVFKNHQQSL